MSKQFRLETYQWRDGEQYCHLLDSRTGLPHQLSLLYLTIKVRNGGKSLSAMQAALGAIHLLLQYFEDHEIDIESRFRKGIFLTAGECEQLRRVSQTHMGRANREAGNVVPLNRGKNGHHSPMRVVESQYASKRLTEMGEYLYWLAAQLGGSFLSEQRARNSLKMFENILELRPRNGNLGGDQEEGIWTEQNDSLLLEIIHPEGAKNPFVNDPGTRVRNYLLVQLLRTLGKRRGEILNLQRRDFNPNASQLSIVRRQDAKEDCRKDRPNVKTREHTLSIAPELKELILEYLKFRREVPGANKDPYLLVTHKAGLSQGGPMTKGALYAVFGAIKKVEPRLRHLHPHLLRHNFNFELSRTFDRQSGDRNFDQEAKIRANVNGWSEHSEMSTTYDKRHVAKKAQAASLATQNELVQLLKNRRARKE